MRILLLSTKFFGYSNRVANQLRKNHVVDEEYAYTPTKNERILRKLFNVTINSDSYFNDISRRLRNIQYDRIIVFGGGSPLPFIAQLRKEHPMAIFILYLSADRRSYGFSDQYISIFDKVLTYSLNDSIEFGYQYRPWFFTDSKISQKKYDISFVGTIHHSRLKVLKVLKHSVLFSIFYYIYSDKLTFIKDFFRWHSLKKYIHFEGMPYPEYIKTLAESVATLDIPELEQTNITTRPIEALATKTKIITTNKYICRYDFYDENNIYILQNTIDNQEIDKIKKWIDLPYNEIDYKKKYNYTIEAFCNELINKE